MKYKGWDNRYKISNWQLTEIYFRYNIGFLKYFTQHPCFLLLNAIQCSVIMNGSLSYKIHLLTKISRIAVSKHQIYKFPLNFFQYAPCHKVSLQSTDPVPLYSMYSQLQNVNKVFLDRNTLFTFCSLLYTLYRGTGSVDQGDKLCSVPPQPGRRKVLSAVLALLNQQHYTGWRQHYLS